MLAAADDGDDDEEEDVDADAVAEDGLRLLMLVAWVTAVWWHLAMARIKRNR